MDNKSAESNQSATEHDRKLIENSFDEFKHGQTVTEEEMLAKFGKYGWGK